LLLSFLNI